MVRENVAFHQYLNHLQFQFQFINSLLSPSDIQIKKDLSGQDDIVINIMTHKIQTGQSRGHYQVMITWRQL